jgi:hypothetical protein
VVPAAVAAVDSGVVAAAAASGEATVAVAAAADSGVAEVVAVSGAVIAAVAAVVDSGVVVAASPGAPKSLLLFHSPSSFSPSPLVFLFASLVLQINQDHHQHPFMLVRLVPRARPCDTSA